MGADRSERPVLMGEDSVLSDLLTQGPSRVTRRVLYGLLGVTIVCALGAALWHLDVTVASTAVIVPEGRTFLIQPETTVIVRQLLVREGDLVERGQELADLEADEAGQQLSALATAAIDRGDALRERDGLLRLEVPQFEQEEKRLTDQKKYNDDCVALFDRKIRAENLDYEVQIEKLRELEVRLKSDIVSASEAVEYRTFDLQSLERLQRDRIVSDLDVLAARRTLTEAKVSYLQALSKRNDGTSDRTVLEARHGKALLDLETDRQRHAFESADAAAHILDLRSKRAIRTADVDKKVELATRRQTLARQKAELLLNGIDPGAVERVEQGGAPTNRIKLLAPVRGRVGFIAVKGRGETVQRGQTLLSVVPDGAPLLIEARVPNREAGRVSVGQRVRIKVDAFPFGDYGMLGGEIQSLAPEADTNANGEATFRAIVVLDQPYFRKNEHNYDLKPGMTATAEIVTERKTLLQILLRPIYEQQP